MSDDFFGQLCFFSFVTIPTSNVANMTREKRVKLATIHCRRSECEEYVANFKIENGNVKSVHAEFSFRECL